ncbi:hypothetical protein OMCYN_01634 [cyanobiont of Ornithocercus magnificus]|nr:hypothetical protein OMCYN_01634 [cyanobiont of Ornithocercus magnificus]
MVSYEKSETVRSIKSALKELGYLVEARILFTPHYGVPQIRWRSIFLASRLGHDPLSLFPLPSYKAKGISNFTTRLDYAYKFFGYFIAICLDYPVHAHLGSCAN